MVFSALTRCKYFHLNRSGNPLGLVDLGLDAGLPAVSLDFVFVFVCGGHEVTIPNILSYFRDLLGISVASCRTSGDLRRFTGF